MRRVLPILSAIALLGIVIAVLLQVDFFTRMKRAEEAAAAALERVGQAQRGFRARAGSRGYATDLASLTTACPGESAALLGGDQLADNYSIVVRAAERAIVTGTDCHGRAVASDYYAAAEPQTEVAGRLGFAMTSRLRIYVFFDGIAPRQADFAFGGLAIPLDAVETFKIP